MFDIGWTEFLVVAVVAILVVGPKDLPRLLRTVGQLVGKGRRMASDFQHQFNAALREAEREVDLEDARKAVADVKSLNPLEGVKKAIDPIRSVGEDLKRDIRTLGTGPAAGAATGTSAAAAAAPAAAASAAAPETATPATATATPATPPPATVDVPPPAVVPEGPPVVTPLASTPPAEPMPSPVPQNPAAPASPAAPIKTGPAGEGA